MRLLLIAVMLAVLSGCGAYSQGSASNSADQYRQTPTLDDTGSIGGSGY